jgi:Trypsin
MKLLRLAGAAKSNREDPMRQVAKCDWGTGLLVRLGLALMLTSSIQAYGQASAAASSAASSAAMDFHLSVDAVAGASIQLANGVVVSASDWPTLTMARLPLQSFISTKTQLATCTGDLVGPRVMLTAAHCADDPLTSIPRPAYLNVDGRRLEFQCEPNPTYMKHPPSLRSPRGSEDYALCLLLDKGVLPATLASMRYDVIDADHVLAQGEKVLMVGFGCDDLQIVDDELAWKDADGKLRIGDQSVASAPSGTVANPAYLVIRAKGAKDHALCPGDSGGPLFTGVTEDTATQTATVRRVRAVNSAVDLEGVYPHYTIASYEASLATVNFRQWASKWAADSSRGSPVVCGITQPAGVYPCRK